VPQNDENTSTYLICHGPRSIDRADIIRVMGLDDERIWNERDCEFRATWENDMNQDRGRMRENWTGSRVSSRKTRSSPCRWDRSSTVQRNTSALRTRPSFTCAGGFSNLCVAQKPGVIRSGYRSATTPSSVPGRHCHRQDDAVAGRNTQSSRRQRHQNRTGLKRATTWPARGEKHVVQGRQ
jgi:hypothetical protein